jgi:hypothetical protein
MGKPMSASLFYRGPDITRPVSVASALAEDLSRVHQGLGPSPADLSDAPVITNWAVGMDLVPVLYGSVVGHPVIGDGHRVLTSPLWLFDPVTGWARTQSRFNRLGRSADELGRIDA